MGRCHLASHNLTSRAAGRADWCGMNVIACFISDQLKEQQADIAAAIAEPLWQKAAAFAAQAHAGEVRADEVSPSFAHATRVAVTVATLYRCQDASVLASALLHNVLEKKDVSFDELETQFGRLIASRVERLSRDPAMDDGVHIMRLHACDWQTRLVMLADAADNLGDDGVPLEERISKTTSVLDLAFGYEQPVLRAQRHLTELLENVSAVSVMQSDGHENRGVTSPHLYASVSAPSRIQPASSLPGQLSAASWMRG